MDLGRSLMRPFNNPPLEVRTFRDIFTHTPLAHMAYGPLVKLVICFGRMIKIIRSSRFLYLVVRIRSCDPVSFPRPLPKTNLNTPLYVCYEILFRFWTVHISPLKLAFRTPTCPFFLTSNIGDQ